jgi:hypothetical protein
MSPPPAENRQIIGQYLQALSGQRTAIPPGTTSSSWLSETVGETDVVARGRH